MVTITHPGGDASSLASRVIQRYFELAASGDADAVADLFAEDAIFMPAPRDGRTFRGAQEIRDYMRISIPRASATFRSLTFYPSGKTCAVEVEAEFAGREGIFEVAEIFTLDDNGRIARMSVYKR